MCNRRQHLKQILVDSLKEGNQIRYLRLAGGIILKLMWKDAEPKYGLDSSDLGDGIGFCEHCDESSIY